MSESKDIQELEGDNINLSNKLAGGVNINLIFDPEEHVFIIGTSSHWLPDDDGPRKYRSAGIIRERAAKISQSIVKKMGQEGYIFKFYTNDPELHIDDDSLDGIAGCSKYNTIKQVPSGKTKENVIADFNAAYEATIAEIKAGSEGKRQSVAAAIRQELETAGVTDQAILDLAPTLALAATKAIKASLGATRG